MSDAELLKMYHDRDERAIQVTMRRYRSYLMKIAVQILGDEQDAEECVNDTLHQVWNRIPPERPSVFRMFLAKFTRNCAINRYRKSRAAKRGGGEVALALEELGECIAGNSDPEHSAMSGELAAAVREFVKSLPEREGNIFLRRYFFTENVSVIAQKYGISYNNVNVVLCHARKKLREYLVKEQFL